MIIIIIIIIITQRAWHLWAYSLNTRDISVYPRVKSQYFLGENKKNHEKLNAPRSKHGTSRIRSTNAIFLLTL